MKSPACRICGHWLPVEDVCIECATEPPPFSLAVYVALYKPPWDEAIIAFKYIGHKYLGRHFAHIAYHRFRTRGLFQGVHLIVPVPIDVLRKHHRGFNQCDILANELSYLLDIPWAEALIRTKFRPPQVGLSPAQRRENIKGAFAPRSPRITRGKVILLVDDVYTTGATVQEAASTLKEEGEAAEVRVLTLARSYP